MMLPCVIIFVVYKVSFINYFHTRPPFIPRKIVLHLKYYFEIRSKFSLLNVSQCL